MTNTDLVLDFGCYILCNKYLKIWVQLLNQAEVGGTLAVSGALPKLLFLHFSFGVNIRVYLILVSYKQIDFTMDD